MSEAKLIGILVATVIFLGAIFFGFRAVYDAGDNAGSAKVQLEFEQFKSDSERLAKEHIAQDAKDKEAALANNEGITNDLQTQLDSMRNLNGDLAKRLSDAQVRASAASSSLSKTNDQLRITAAALASSLGQINGAIADALNECGANNAKYKALIAELTPQL